MPEALLVNAPPLAILFEDADILVVDKPGGLLTQAPPGIDSLERRIKSNLPPRVGRDDVYLGVPHRLDRPVSGAMVFAKNRRMARRLSEQFEARTVTKRYAALVAGQVTPDVSEWHDWMRKVPDEPRAEIVRAGDPDALHAALRYVVRERRAEWTRLEIELTTGRMHQIRLQAAVRGHAVLGDEQYGSTLAFGPTVADPRERWIALHARHLAFDHPRTRQTLAFDAPWPAFFERS